MKSVVFALALFPFASAFKTKEEAAPAPFTEKVLGSIRGLYTPNVPVNDPYYLYNTPTAVCIAGIVDHNNCYSGTDTTTLPGYTIGPCATCTGSGSVPNAAYDECYTCPTGITRHVS